MNDAAIGAGGGREAVWSMFVSRRYWPVFVAVIVSLVMNGVPSWTWGAPAPALRIGTPLIAYSVRADVDEHLYTIDLTTGATVDIGPVGTGDVEALTFSCDGVLYGIDDGTSELVRINTTTGAGTVIGPLGVSINHPGLTFDDQGRLWLADEDTQNLYLVNLTTGAATLVGPTGREITALAFRNGVLYGIDDNTDTIVRINTTTGAATAVGAALGIALDEGGIDFDADGVLWGVEDLGFVFTINTATGVATFTSVTLDGFESLAIQGDGCGQAASATPTSTTQGAPDEDSPRKPTKEQRQQRQRTNHAGLDTYALEGNVVEVGTDAQGTFLVIGNRDGRVTVRLHKDAAKSTVCVGYYVTVSGEKQHEFLFEADDLSVDQKSDSKVCVN